MAKNPIETLTQQCGDLVYWARNRCMHYMFAACAAVCPVEAILDGTDKIFTIAKWLPDMYSEHDKLSWWHGRTGRTHKDRLI